jgi:hypothetical protein
MHSSVCRCSALPIRHFLAFSCTLDPLLQRDLWPLARLYHAPRITSTSMLVSLDKTYLTVSSLRSVVSPARIDEQVRLPAP